jgi:hypothetical protein
MPVALTTLRVVEVAQLPVVNTAAGVMARYMPALKPGVVVTTLVAVGAVRAVPARVGYWPTTCCQPCWITTFTTATP